MSMNDHAIVSMEEGQAERITEKQASETSSGIDQITEVLPENAAGSSLSSIVAEKLKRLDDVLIDKKAGDKKRATAPIQKVPMGLRQKESLRKYFEPRVVSIGPYHHHNQNVKVTEEVKLKLAAIFMEEHLSEDKKDLYFKIKMKVEDLRKCYEPEATQRYDDDYLALMFLLDGCVVLHFIHGVISQSWKGLEILETVADLTSVLADLVLLENQLPYQVLELVISSSENGEMLKKSIQKFMTCNPLNENQKPSVENPDHLLDGIRTAYLMQYVENDKKSSFMVQIIEKSIKIIGMLPDTPLRFIRMIFDRILQIENNFFVIHPRSIEELMEAGIKLKPNNTGCLRDISFSHGTLKIPHIFFNQATPFEFLNLVAYEMCLNFSSSPKVSSYIAFLTSLVIRAEDVKQLRVNKIIYDNFDSNEEALQIFEVLKAADLSQSFVFHHADILKEMHNHCDKKYYAWKAQLKRTYFRSPWSLMALIGAIVVLGLTILQTVYTVYGYYKQ